MKKIRCIKLTGILIILLFFTITAFAGQLGFWQGPSAPKRIPKPWSENDPIFSKHPTNKLSNSDVEKVKNMDTIIVDTVKDVIGSTTNDPITRLPELDAPPADAMPGDRYINSGSGNVCYYVCKKTLNTMHCVWATNPEAIKYINNDKLDWPLVTTPCKAVNTGNPPAINFIDMGSPEEIDYGDSASFGIKITDNDSNPFYGASDTTVYIYLVEISDTGWTFARQPIEGRTNMLRLNEEISATISKYTIAKMERALIIRFSTNGSAIYNMNGLPAGIYGFIFEAFDSDNNRTVSEPAPVKIRYIPE